MPSQNNLASCGAGHIPHLPVLVIVGVCLEEHAPHARAKTKRTRWILLTIATHSVVNQANTEGSFSATPENTHSQMGKRLVNHLAPVSYA